MTEWDLRRSCSAGEGVGAGNGSQTVSEILESTEHIVTRLRDERPEWLSVGTMPCTAAGLM
jgi:hypothetical protein